MTTLQHFVTRAGAVCLASFLLMAGLAITAADAVADEAAPGDSSTVEDGKRDQPVLLLTGFAPFGPGRPENPSWEGIKNLDGCEWHGYRLACRELKVEWGAPLVQLNEWIDKLHPEVVFSFGQGGPDGFAIETRAHNRRGATPDNLGQLPPTPMIVAEGPDEFQVTADAQALVTALTSQGHQVRVSTDAGRYLCEEAFYTLEYLKSLGRVSGDVLFCHVPPFGESIGNVRVDAEYVQHFVESLLSAWVGLKRDKATLAAPAATFRQATADPRDQEVRDLIAHYFRTWSAQDVERYGQCFMPQAVIQLVDPKAGLTSMPLRVFLETQRQAHRDSTEPMKETPESVEVRFEGRLARVVVFWKLTVGEREETGYDHFTLLQSGGDWRIANLIFYESGKIDSAPASGRGSGAPE